MTNTNRQVQMGRTALPGDARQDWWIIQIARRIGLDWRYEHPRDVYAEMARAMPSLNNITWERLERESSVTYPCDAPDAAGHDIVFGDRFPTDDGRGRFTPARIVPPDELPDEIYPMVLHHRAPARALAHRGDDAPRARYLDAPEPEATASPAPKELRRLGVARGNRSG